MTVPKNEVVVACRELAAPKDFSRYSIAETDGMCGEDVLEEEDDVETPKGVNMRTNAIEAYTNTAPTNME